MAASGLHPDDLTLDVRKWVTQIEEVHADGGVPTARPIRKVVVAAVLTNPYAGTHSESLDELITAGVLARVFMTRAQELLDGGVKSYGKAGVVGEDGELEHIAALLHPEFGGPTRALAGGISILPSVKKRGGQGATVDIPVHHKDAMMIRDYFDSIEFRVPDAPRHDEILVALGASDGPRPHPRVGGLSEADAVGVDGLR